MAKHVLKNVRLFCGGADLTTVNNKVELAAEHEEKDVTNYGSVDANGELWKEVIAGLGSAKVAAGGQWEAGDTGKVDDVMWAALGGAGAWTIYPAPITPGSSAAAGDLAYVVNGLNGAYKLGDQVGNVAPWEAGCASAWPAARGKGLHPPGTARTATGNGTSVELDAAPGAGQYLYASLHVLSVSGTTPSLTVKVQSDDATGFPSATDRITFAAATARGSQIARLAGPITDTFYRVNFTISGTSPSFLFVGAVGVM